VGIESKPTCSSQLTQGKVFLYIWLLRLLYGSHREMSVVLFADMLVILTISIKVNYFNVGLNQISILTYLHQYQVIEKAMLLSMAF
jgi:hypothetical protein